MPCKEFYHNIAYLRLALDGRFLRIKIPDG